MDYWGGGGGQVHIHVQSMGQTRGCGGQKILNLLLDAIWWNLGLFLAQTICVIKASIKA